jgi:hypothetical protein
LLPDRRRTPKVGFGDVYDSADYSITTSAQRDGITHLDETARSSDGTLREYAVELLKALKRHQAELKMSNRTEYHDFGLGVREGMERRAYSERPTRSAATGELTCRPIFGPVEA